MKKIILLSAICFALLSSCGTMTVKRSPLPQTVYLKKTNNSVPPAVYFLPLFLAIPSLLYAINIKRKKTCN